MKQLSLTLPLHYSHYMPTLIKNNTCIDISSDIKSGTLLTQWLGKSRQECLQSCRENNLQIINFAHWLSVPELQLVLTFKYQRCVEAISSISEAAEC